MDMKEMVTYVCQNYEQFGWRTVVIDSLTYYTDIWIQDLMTKRWGDIGQRGKKEFEARMTTADWGMLEYHIMKELVPRLHGTKLNVIWTALTKEKRDGEHIYEIGLDVSGASGRKLPGVCKLVLYAEHEHLIDANQQPYVVPKYWPRPPNVKVKNVRHRYGRCFPHGCLVDPHMQAAYPTFEAVRSEIGRFIYM
jgi:hypothetical protein